MDGLDGASSIPPIITPGTSATPQGVESSDTSSSGSTISTIRLGNLQVVSLTAILSGMTLLINFETGVFGMNARTLTEENLGLSSREAYWAIHCYYITAACSIIIFGKASDILGPKPVWLAGCTAYFIATTLYAAEHNLAQLVMVRTLLGLAVAMCVPTVNSIITMNVEKSRRRNLIIAINGLAGPFGYGMGLLVGGMSADEMGLQPPFWLSSGLSGGLVISSFLVLPGRMSKEGIIWHLLLTDIDWVGLTLITIPTALMCFVLGMIPVFLEDEQWHWHTLALIAPSVAFIVVLV